MRCKILFLLVVYSVLGFGQPLNRSIVRTTQYLSTDSIRPLSADKPYANNQYTAELTIIDQDGFECGYESIEKTESGFTVTLEETGNYTIEYVTNKI